MMSGILYNIPERTDKKPLKDGITPCLQGENNSLEETNYVCTLSHSFLAWDSTLERTQGDTTNPHLAPLDTEVYVTVVSPCGETLSAKNLSTNYFMSS